MGLLAHAAETLTNVDGRLARSFARLVLRPGELTAAYMRGQRKLYVAPFQLFLITNVTFFVLQALVGAQVLSNGLDSHLWNQSYSDLARALAQERITAASTTVEQYRPVFDHAVTVNAKALVVVFVPMYALLAFLLHPRRRYLAVTHVVFALHFLSFLLVLFIVVLPLLAVPTAYLLGYLGQPEQLADPFVSWVMIGVCGLYGYKAFGTVYGDRRWLALVKAAIFGVVLITLIRVYRLIVFLFTLYTTT